MADLANRAEQVADLVLVKIGNDDAEFMSSVTMSTGMDIVRKTNTRTGTTPQGAIVQGVAPSGTLLLNQSNAAAMKRSVHVASGAPSLNRGAGYELTPVPMTITDPQDSGGTRSIHFFSVIFEGLERDADGEGLAEWPVNWFAVADSSGNVFRIGPAA